MSESVSSLVFLLPGTHRPTHRPCKRHSAGVLSDGQVVYKCSTGGIVRQLKVMGIDPRVGAKVSGHAFLLPLEEIAWHEKHRHKHRIAAGQTPRDYAAERARIAAAGPSNYLDLDLSDRQLQEATKWLNTTRLYTQHKHDMNKVLWIGPTVVCPPWNKNGGHLVHVGELRDRTKVYRYRSGGIFNLCTAAGIDPRSTCLEEAWLTEEEHVQRLEIQRHQRSEKRMSSMFEEAFGDLDSSGVEELVNPPQEISIEPEVLLPRNDASSDYYSDEDIDEMERSLLKLEAEVRTIEARVNNRKRYLKAQQELQLLPRDGELFPDAQGYSCLLFEGAYRK